MSSITICNPQLGVSARLKDWQLQQRTYAQVRQLSRDRGLDVSRLTEKWEIIHTLVEHHLHDVEEPATHFTNTRRRTILDLPGEIRNQIYSYILVEAEPLIACYGVDFHSLYGVSPIQHLWIFPTAQQLKTTYDVVERLRNVSRTNRQLHRECLSYFYAHNEFRVQSLRSDSFASFLNDIGSHGRAHIGRVRFDTSYRTRYGETMLACTNLQELQVVMPLGYILSGASCSLVRRYLDGLYEELPEGFASLPSLCTFELVCIFPPEPEFSDFQQYVRLEAAQRRACAAILAQLERQMASKHAHVAVWPL